MAKVPCCVECGRELGPLVEVEVEAEIIFRTTRKITVKARTPAEAERLGKEQAEKEMNMVYEQIESNVDDCEVEGVTCDTDQFGQPPRPARRR